MVVWRVYNPSSSVEAAFSTHRDVMPAGADRAAENSSKAVCFRNCFVTADLA